MVLPYFARELRSFITWVAVNESRPVVGSSKNIRLGSVMSSTPMDVLFLSPPETPLMRYPPMNVLEHFYSFRSFII